MTGPVVLIVTHPADVHADAVQVHLDAAGVEVHRIDTADLGTAAPLTAHLRDGTFSGNFGGCDLATVFGVWHRRPSQIAAGNPDDAAELRAGVLAALPCLSHPADMAVAGFKPYRDPGCPKQRARPLLRRGPAAARH